MFKECLMLKITKNGEFAFPEIYKDVKTIFISKKDFYVIGSDNESVIKKLSDSNDVSVYSRIVLKPKRFNSNPKYLERDKECILLGFGNYFKLLSYNDHYEIVWELNEYLRFYIKWKYKYSYELEKFFKNVYKNKSKDSNIEFALNLKNKLILTQKW